jgi:DNA-binding transcriptional LysR family regulator
MLHMTNSSLPYPPSIPLTPRADPLASSFATSYAGVVAFIAVVTEGSFARAADRLGIGRSAVSRSVQKLEDQLNVRLFTRTTRSTTLTREGDLFYANCHTGVDRIVQAVEEMRDLREGPPRGHLRISCAVGFGRRVVGPLLEDAQIIAKQIIPMQLLVCASPGYREAHGMPESVDDLLRHQCINFRTASGRISEWEFKVDGQLRRFMPPSRLTYNDADLVLQSVLDGHGIAQMAGYLVCEPLREGALVACLTRHVPDDHGHYICYLSRQHLPSRMRVFIDFMTARIRAADLHCLTDLGAPA